MATDCEVTCCEFIYFHAYSFACIRREAAGRLTVVCTAALPTCRRAECEVIIHNYGQSNTNT